MSKYQNRLPVKRMWAVYVNSHPIGFGYSRDRAWEDAFPRSEDMALAKQNPRTYTLHKVQIVPDWIRRK